MSCVMWSPRLAFVVVQAALGFNVFHCGHPHVKKDDEVYFDSQTRSRSTKSRDSILGSKLFWCLTVSYYSILGEMEYCK